MRNERFLQRLRVFIAGPADVTDEKNCVRTVIDELNRPGGIADKLGFLLQPFEGNQAVPGAGRPQAVIFEGFPVETWDVFVGILWCRFGTPTGASDNQTGESYESGTEEEFMLAYEQYIKTGWPRIMIYRCQRPVPPHHISSGQLKLMETFFDRLSPKGDDPCLWKPFTSTTELERLVRQDLTSLLHKLKDDVTGRLEPVTETVLPAGQIDQIPSHEAAAVPVSPTLKSGQTYELSILSVDIVKHSFIVERYPVESKILLANFKRFVDQYVTERQGVYIAWAADGGIFAFEGVNRADRATLTGMALVKNISVFNMDAGQNPLLHKHISIQIRVAAHDGLVLYKDPPNEISSSVINDVKHLESDYTDPGKFQIFDMLYRGISEALATQFSYKMLLNTIKVWSYDGARRDWPPKDDEELEELVKQTENISKSLRENLTNDMLSIQEDENRQKIDMLYSYFDRFLNWFPHVHDHWEVSYLESIDKLIQRLLVSEDGFFNKLRELCASLKKESATSSILNPIFDYVSARHTDRLKLDQLSSLIVSMIKRKMDFKSDLQVYDLGFEKVATKICETKLLEKIQRLTEADDLQEELALTDIITTEREELIRLITSNAQFDNREALLQKLWSLSDIVLMEEETQTTVSPIIGRLFVALTEDSWIGKKFIILKWLLEDQGSSLLNKADFFLRAVQTSNVETDFDFRVVWRGLLVAHSNPAVVSEAARTLPHDAIWRTASYNKVPIVAVQALAESFESDVSDDKRKIFFDCVGPRLLTEITKGTAWCEIGSLIEQFFFRWNFFIEDHYFNRLEDLLSRYTSRAAKHEMDTGLFKGMIAKIRAVRIDKGNPKTQIPKGLESLDLAVQRHLARDGCHIDFFVLHPDDRIALETLPFIRLENLEKWINYRQLNGTLFREILRRPEFFGRSSTVLAALNHPKCTPEFAAQYLPRVSAIERAKIAKNVNANSVVRNLARQLAAR